METPGPFSYNQDDKHVKMTRFAGISLGYGVKSNMKQIKTCPGPADYITVKENDNAVVKPCFNFKLNQGGIKKPRTMQQGKEDLVKQSVDRNGSTHEMRFHSPRSGQLSIFAPKNRNDIIQKNKMAVNTANYVMMNTSTYTNYEKKYGPVDSESNGGTMTNYTKSKEVNDSFQNVSIFKAHRESLDDKKKKNKRIKFLPKLLNDQRVSPRVNLQYSNDFKKISKKRRDDGYDTDGPTERHQKFI